MTACYGYVSIPEGTVRRIHSGGACPPDARVEDEMRYAILIYDEASANPPAEPPSPEAAQRMHAAYGKYTQMLHDRGAFLGGDALQPVQTATSVRVQDGRTMTTDGPFAETKEALAGFYLVEAKDLDEALELAAACPGAQVGTIEVRPVWDVPTDGAEQAQPAGAAANA
jgi:hypothetical protein